MQLSADCINSFQQFIWQFYTDQGRSFAWRHTQDPYHIFISEVMLQQTQTQRVEIKFEEFLRVFPAFNVLAYASTRDLLIVWKGLGYNRRALYLQRSAQKIVTEYNGTVPNDPAILVTFPGIGKATAASICAFAYNNPTIFIETNIRAVFIHTFFKNSTTEIHDNQIMPLVQTTIDRSRPRDWYYALMDYGVYLKKMFPNPNKKSVHYTKQSKFEGSDRQIRGMILRILTEKEWATAQHIAHIIKHDVDKVNKIIKTLEKDNFVKIIDNKISFI